MMKWVGFFLLLLSSVTGQSFNNAQIRNQIRGHYNNNEYSTFLSIGALDADGTYQNAALTRTQTALAGVSGITAVNIRNYFVLATIFEATNAKSNPKVFDEPIVGWSEAVEGVGAWFVGTQYCSWFGIRCFDDRLDDEVGQEENGEIIELLLANFTMFGEWPNEIALLSETLVTIDLFANFFLYASDYRWFKPMKKLEFLFFGTTSWNANGVPAILKDLPTLRELDFSNSFWSEGPIRGEAFSTLKELRYIRMADNIYDTTGINQLAVELVELPNLIRLYMQNCRFTPNRPNFNFVAKMPAIVELWADFTRFNQGIPASMGNATTLRSFSAVYCNLKGPIPGELVRTSMDRMWLTGNSLTGPFPTVLGNLLWRFLFLEDNDLTGGLPDTLCAKVGTGETDLNELGADCDVCGDNECCTCCGEDCGNTIDPTPAPTGPPTGFCFSGESNVEVEHRGEVKMGDLSIGDSVKVAENKYEPVYSFGHKNDSASTEFLKIVTDGQHKPLEISKDHMVIAEGGRTIPASMLQRGDNLVTASGDLVAVKSIRTVVRKGAYAPFTESGSIIVNDIVASNYVAFQGTEYLVLGGFKTPLTWQWMAHTFKSFHRVAVMMGITSETYTESGVSQWVDMPNKYGLWLLEQSPLVVLSILLPSIAFFGFFSILEILLLSPITSMTVVAGILTVLAARRSVSVQMKSKQM